MAFPAAFHSNLSNQVEPCHKEDGMHSAAIVIKEEEHLPLAEAIALTELSITILLSLNLFLLGFAEPCGIQPRSSAMESTLSYVKSIPKDAEV